MDMSQATMDDSATCPHAVMGDEISVLSRDSILVLEHHKRIVLQRIVSQDGAPELHLFYGDKHVSFDETDLFAFAETLARTPRFAAGDVTSWGEALEWPRMRDLLDVLIAEGVLQHEADVADDAGVPADRSVPSRLPASVCPVARDWSTCEEITGEIAGRAVELAYLELVIPMFRVAHVFQDQDGRQVGEANVFPRALRLDVPTDWMTSIYPGTRYLSDRPMNVTALKGMRAHWPQMMAALHHIRARFLELYPEVASGWTVGALERLAALVLAVPTYQLMHPHRPVANGDLHPALSSMFRVTDGLRMTMHQMLFVPIGEPAMSALAPMTSEEILDYAERNYSFHSETGVCAGPKIMVREFLSVLVDGVLPKSAEGFIFDQAVVAALADLPSAFRYGLRGLRAHAAIFSIWPAMTRSYDVLARIADGGVEDGLSGFAPFQARMQELSHHMRTATYLAEEDWRRDRESVYADMFEMSGRGLGLPETETPFLARLSSRVDASVDGFAARLDMQLSARFDIDVAHPRIVALSDALVDFCLAAQARIRLGCDEQASINDALGRSPATRAFSAADMDVFNLLQGRETRRLPFLLDEAPRLFGIRLYINSDAIDFVPEEAEAT